MKKVAIVMGSDSDLPVVQKAVDILKAFDVPYRFANWFPISWANSGVISPGRKLWIR